MEDDKPARLVIPDDAFRMLLVHKDKAEAFPVPYLTFGHDPIPVSIEKGDKVLVMKSSQYRSSCHRYVSVYWVSRGMAPGVATLCPRKPLGVNAVRSLPSMFPEVSAEARGLNIVKAGLVSWRKAALLGKEGSLITIRGKDCFVGFEATEIADAVPQGMVWRSKRGTVFTLPPDRWVPEV